MLEKLMFVVATMIVLFLLIVIGAQIRFEHSMTKAGYAQGWVKVNQNV